MSEKADVSSLVVRIKVDFGCGDSVFVVVLTCRCNTKSKMMRSGLNIKECSWSGCTYFQIHSHNLNISNGIAKKKRLIMNLGPRQRVDNSAH